MGITILSLMLNKQRKSAKYFALLEIFVYLCNKKNKNEL